VRTTVRTITTAAAVALGALVAGPAGPVNAQQAPVGAFADAFGVLVDVTTLAGNVPVEAGPIADASQSCPPQAAEADVDTTLDVAVPDNGSVASSTTIESTARADCTGPSAQASSETEEARVLTSGTDPATVSLLSADVIDSTANASCDELSASTLFVNLKITNPNNPAQAIEVPANPPPNTRIDIPGLATIILNEQNLTADGTGILVNGVHIIGASDLLRGDIILSHALATIGGCPAGSTPANPGELEAPEITFAKEANPTTVSTPGEQVTYTATVRNTGEDDCDVLRFIDHLSPAFDFVSTSGDFGDTPESTDPRADGGVDVVLSPTDVVIPAGEEATQTFVVALRSGVGPGTYFNNLEIFCSQQGNFASGALAPVTVPAAPAAPPPPQQPQAQAPQNDGPLLAATGVEPWLAAGALLLLVGGAFALRRNGQI
jgi:uncharacterized repeat protein (TIGR01451 family)